ncbi:unnamed protein product [Rhodiola kirilowii]
MIGLLLLLPAVSRPPLRLCFSRIRCSYGPNCNAGKMGSRNFNSLHRKAASFRLCNVSGHTTELLGIGVQNNRLHVLVIPGNPGIVTYYKEFVESLYDMFEGRAFVTAVGHISHTNKDWENGQLFSIEDQIEHKVDFLKHELANHDSTVILVGHSIGAYISLEVFRREPELVAYCIGLYPFLALNMKSSKQSMIGKLSASSILCAALSSLAGILGLLPKWASIFIAKNSVGRSWSATAIEATCTHLLQYHALRNVFFMAMTEFQKFSVEPDWTVMKDKPRQIAFLFGIDDHWGPLSLYEEVSKTVPDIDLSIEREGHTHSFCCTEAGSLWVAQYVATLVENKFGKQS